MLTSKTFAVLFSDHPLAPLLLIWCSFNFETEDSCRNACKELGEGKGEMGIIHVRYRRKDASERSVSLLEEVSWLAARE